MCSSVWSYVGLHDVGGPAHDHLSGIRMPQRPRQQKITVEQDLVKRVQLGTLCASLSSPTPSCPARC
eukprot:scaffold94557_cov61-Phaeocystis_antarctica.AAC.1